MTSPNLQPTVFSSKQFDWVYDTVWSPDGKNILVLWSADIDPPAKSRASLFRLSNFAEIWAVDDFSRHALYQPDGKSIITVDVSISSWDAATGQFLDVLYGPGNGLLYPAFITNKSQLLLGRTFAEGPAKFITEIGLLSPPQKSMEVDITQTGALAKLGLAPDQSQFFTAFTNLQDSNPSNMIFLWDLTTRQKKCSFPGDAAAFYPNQSVIAVLSQDGGKIITYDRNTCDSLSILDEQKTINLFSLSPDGKFLGVSAFQDKSVQILNAKDGKQIYEIDTAPSEVQNFAFSPDGHFLSTVEFIEDANRNREYTVRIWTLPPYVP